MRALPLALLLALAVASGGSAARAADDTSIVVCPTCPETSLVKALDDAPTGATIEVRGGTYVGNLSITRDVQLIGVDNPVIDAGGQGTAIQVSGAALTLQGFTVRHTGTSLDHEDSAILVDKGRATIVGNRIEDALFGVYLKESPGSIVRDNVVVSLPLDIALRGDPIRVWYCDDVTIEGNVARDGRDVILWYSNRGLVKDNIFDGGRYGLHLMFSDSARIEGNSLRDNSIGLYIMYSRDPLVIGNSLSDNHGASGGGLGLKDVDRAVIESNRFINNHIAVQIDTSPREPGIENYFRGNVVAFNEIGIAFEPAVRHNTLTGNSFVDNNQHVSILGTGELRDITWSVDGKGNYWSDYVGYDANGDGIGDVPYTSQNLFESLMDDHPSLRLFMFSPAAMAVDFAAKAFPSIRPHVKFVDDAPLMRPPVAANLPPVERASTPLRLLGGGAGILAALGALLAIRVLRRRQGGARHAASNRRSKTAVEPLLAAPSADDRAGTQPDILIGAHGRQPVAGTASAEGAARGGATATGDSALRDSAVRDTKDGDTMSAAFVTVAGVTKRYGKVAAVDDISFEVAPGEAVALWGPNGAGKTTILRCLLGLARYSGDVRIDGIDPRKDGRASRRLIGYVPQDLAVAAMTVGEMASFIARLKRITPDDATAALERLGIGDQLDKPVAALSGGMRQRLALALALIGSPKVLLLDEPTANLDARGRAELLGLLRKLKLDGLTLIFSSHRPDDVLALADRILVVRAGVLRAELDPAQFANEIDGASRLVVTLANGHHQEAVATLARLGVEVSGEGKVLSVAIPAREKARVISALVREGIDLADFDMEHGSASGPQPSALSSGTEHTS